MTQGILARRDLYFTGIFFPDEVSFHKQADFSSLVFLTKILAFHQLTRQEFWKRSSCGTTE
jgi:hypothetical protein